MKRHLFIFSICASMLIFARVSMADVAVPEKLGIKEAVGIALKANANLKVAETSKEDSLSILRQNSIDTTYSMGASSGFNRASYLQNMSGQLFGGLAYNGLAGTTASLQVAPFGTGVDRGSIAFSLQHPLLQGNGHFSDKYDAVRSAFSGTVVQGKQLYISKQSTVFGVVSAYYQAVLAREQVKVQEGAVKLAEENAEYLRRREEAELERGLDVTQSQVYVAQAKDALNQAEQTARGAVDSLMMAMGIGVGQVPELIDGIPESSMEMPDLEKSIRTALNNRSELAVYDEQLYEDKRKLDIKKDKLRPAMNLVASVNSTNIDSGLLSTNAFDAGATSVGLVYTFPIDKRAAVEDKNIAARALTTLKKQRDFTTEQVADDVRTAYRALDAARISLTIFTQNLDIAKENLRIAHEMVDEGVGDSRDEITAQQNLAGIMSSIVSAKTELYLARIRLKYAMGEDLTMVELK